MCMQMTGIIGYMMHDSCINQGILRMISVDAFDLKILARCRMTAA